MNKDSREQFEMRTHKRLIDILGPIPDYRCSVHLDYRRGVDIESAVEQRRRDSKNSFPWAGES